MSDKHHYNTPGNQIQIKAQLSGERSATQITLNPHDFQQLQHPDNGRIISISRREPDFIKRLMRCGYLPVGGAR